MLSQRIGALAVGGGAIIVLGSCLSWFSLFAGLQPYRGIDVLHGRLLAGGGVLCVVLGVWFGLRRRAGLRWGIGLLGFALVAFGMWSEVQLRILYRQLSADPFVVARVGPGLSVAIAGAVFVFTTLFLGDE